MNYSYINMWGGKKTSIRLPGFCDRTDREIIIFRNCSRPRIVLDVNSPNNHEKCLWHVCRWGKWGFLRIFFFFYQHCHERVQQKYKISTAKRDQHTKRYVLLTFKICMESGPKTLKLNLCILSHTPLLFCITWVASYLAIHAFFASLSQ